MSKTMIRRVEPRSPAAKAGVQAGETLAEINGKQILDVLDYKFYSYDARLTLTLQAPDGASRTLRVRKEEGEDLGLEFETSHGPGPLLCQQLHLLLCGPDAAGDAGEPLFQG